MQSAKEREAKVIAANALVWITFRISGEKYYGKVFPKDYTDIGKSMVRIISPIMPLTQNAKQIKREEMTFRLCLDPLDYLEAFQVFNTTLWTCWQVVDPALKNFYDSVATALGKAAMDERDKVYTKATEANDLGKVPTPVAPEAEKK